MKRENSVATEREQHPITYATPEIHVNGSAVKLTKGSDYDEDEEDFTKCISGAALIVCRD
jgi:hypothetical protein